MHMYTDPYYTRITKLDQPRLARNRYGTTGYSPTEYCNVKGAFLDDSINLKIK